MSEITAQPPKMDTENKGIIRNYHGIPIRILNYWTKSQRLIANHKLHWRLTYLSMKLADRLREVEGRRASNVWAGLDVKTIWWTCLKCSGFFYFKQFEHTSQHRYWWLDMIGLAVCRYFMMFLLFQGCIFKFHVSFLGCTSIYIDLHYWDLKI